MLCAIAVMYLLIGIVKVPTEMMTDSSAIAVALFVLCDIELLKLIFKK